MKKKVLTTTLVIATIVLGIIGYYFQESPLFSASQTSFGESEQTDRSGTQERLDPSQDTELIDLTCESLLEECFSLTDECIEILDKCLYFTTRCDELTQWCADEMNRCVTVSSGEERDECFEEAQETCGRQITICTQSLLECQEAQQSKYEGGVCDLMFATCDFYETTCNDEEPMTGVTL